jgi:hypothetical protein
MNYERDPGRVKDEFTADFAQMADYPDGHIVLRYQFSADTSIPYVLFQTSQEKKGVSLRRS